MTRSSDSMLLETINRLAAAADNDDGVVKQVPARPGHLKRGQALIIVVEGKAVAVRTVDWSKEVAGNLDRFVRELAALGAVLGETPEWAHSTPGGLTTNEVAVLKEGGLTAPAEPPAPADDPLARSILAYTRLVAASLSVEKAAKRLGVEPSRVRQRLGSAAPSLIGFKVGRAWRLPIEQFEGRATLPGLEDVVPALPRDLHPLEVVQWLTVPDPDLVPRDEGEPLSPRDWLRAGHPPAAVVDRAREIDFEG